MRSLVISAVLAGTVAAGAITTVAVAADDPPPPSNSKTLVGIMIDGTDAQTETEIDCGRDGRHETVDGDGTLFMPNLDPHRVTCRITIRPR